MEHAFVLSDAAGVERRYTLTLHSTSEGWPLVTHLNALLVEPLVAGIGPIAMEGLSAMLADPSKAAGLKGGISIDKLAELVQDPAFRQSLDWSRLSAGVRSALIGLNPAIQQAILKYTNRDGQPLFTEGRPTVAYDTVYQANYTELGQALYHVVRANSFIPGLDTIAEGVGPMVDLMRGMLGNAG